MRLDESNSLERGLLLSRFAHEPREWGRPWRDRPGFFRGCCDPCEANSLCRVVVSHTVVVNFPDDGVYYNVSVFTTSGVLIWRAWAGASHTGSSKEIQAGQPLMASDGSVYVPWADSRYVSGLCGCTKFDQAGNVEWEVALTAANAEVSGEEAYPPGSDFDASGNPVVGCYISHVDGAQAYAYALRPSDGVVVRTYGIAGSSFPGGFTHIGPTRSLCIDGSNNIFFGRTPSGSPGGFISTVYKANSSGTYQAKLDAPNNTNGLAGSWGRLVCNKATGKFYSPFQYAEHDLSQPAVGSGGTVFGYTISGGRDWCSGYLKYGLDTIVAGEFNCSTMTTSWTTTLGQISHDIPFDSDNKAPILVNEVYTGNIRVLGCDLTSTGTLLVAWGFQGAAQYNSATQSPVAGSCDIYFQAASVGNATGTGYLTDGTAAWSISSRDIGEAVAICANPDVTKPWLFYTANHGWTSTGQNIQAILETGRGAWLTWNLWDSAPTNNVYTLGMTSGCITSVTTSGGDCCDLAVSSPPDLLLEVAAVPSAGSCCLEGEVIELTGSVIGSNVSYRGGVNCGVLSWTVRLQCFNGSWSLSIIGSGDGAYVCSFLAESPPTVTCSPFNMTWTGLFSEGCDTSFTCPPKPNVTITIVKK